MTDAGTIVQRFVAAWDGPDLDSVAGLLHPGIRFANGPLPVLEGRAAVMDYLRAAGPFEACRWELLALAADGGRVLTERLDRLRVRGADIVLPVMGIFEVADGLIRHWRDYFDLAAYRAQWPR
jgi:limonene-1,2-epoxide hydrolase